MQPLSPRQYFETRLRQLPIFKCLVNDNWQETNVAHVSVLRRHVNGKLSGSAFLVDLLCLGVKDAYWFFNEDADEMMEKLESNDLDMVEIPYDLAHNIVYAGHDFAADYEIKPHPDFAIARFALEEDDDNIPLIDIETGLDGIPHLMERHPGQYADALLKLKKHAGEGNYKHSVVFNSMHEADEMEADWGDEDEDDAEEDTGYLLSEIPLGELTLNKVSFLSTEDLNNTTLINERIGFEQIQIKIEKLVRDCEMLTTDEDYFKKYYNTDVSDKLAAEKINELTEDDLAWSIAYPNGCEPEQYKEAYDQLSNFIKETIDQEESDIYWQKLFELAENGAVFLLAHCVTMLLTKRKGPEMYKKLMPAIKQNSQYPLVALAQSILVTAKPDQFTDEPFIKNNSPLLKEAITEYAEFNDQEYCLFYCLRCLQAAKQKQFFQTIAWYRKLAETDEADIFPSMISTLNDHISDVCENFLKAKLDALGSWR